MKTIATFTLTILSITATFAQKRIKGNGNVVTIERTIGDYDALRIGGFYEVELVEGAEGKITLKGEDNILEYVETDVKGRTLVIKSKDNKTLKPSQGEGVYIIVPVEKIDAIRLSGSGKVIGTSRLQADSFKVHTSGSRNANLKIDATSVSVITSGSSTIALSGNTKKMDITSSGSSNLRAYDLNADDVGITSSGSSNIEVTANNIIHSRVSGSGNIRYKGNPEKVNTKTSGSGRVTKN